MFISFFFSVSRAQLLLPVADIYKIDNLLIECKNLLIEKFQSFKTDEERIHLMVLAQNFTLPELYELCVNQLCEIPHEKMERLCQSVDINIGTLYDIAVCRLRLLEASRHIENVSKFIGTIQC